MPKGRGSNERRRSARQKMARRVNKIHALGIDPNDPVIGIYRKMADAYERQRRLNMQGKAPKTASRRGKGNTWSMSDANKRSKKYWQKQQMGQKEGRL
ncbi:hypothetical protein LCGC14_1540810 [marine sediment metagenome]|uniref:Uncharacterized protein n=1 Tax=marine sediment metagenome TaxID=412755 RepID=A0A0F9JE26_9ZZZZ